MHLWWKEAHISGQATLSRAAPLVTSVKGTRSKGKYTQKQQTKILSMVLTMSFLVHIASQIWGEALREACLIQSLYGSITFYNYIHIKL